MLRPSSPLTPQWMAPEVLANQRYSNKADIYSFGMVMWECCARQVPFEGLNGVQAGEGAVGRWSGSQASCCTCLLLCLHRVCCLPA